MLEVRTPIQVFYSYSQEDELLQQELEKHLSLFFQRQNLIIGWHSRLIVPGTDWNKEIDTQLEISSIILLLISASFFADDYRFGVEMKRALQRHEKNEARVIPILLRPVDLAKAPFIHLDILPANGKPITSWTNQDEAFAEVAATIRATIEDFNGTSHHSRSRFPRKTSHPPIHTTYTASNNTVPHTSKVKHNYRQRLLERVRSSWITSVLEHSLYGKIPITPGLCEDSSLVQNPWKTDVQETEIPPQQLPLDIRLIDIYNTSAHELLILGEPGAGKTTLLLELLYDLLEHAERNETQPIPVVFNLSSWTSKRQPLSDWLVAELKEKYHVPLIIGKKWIETDQVLPLLDGLDEVTPKFITECVNAINVYREQENHSMLSMVVCSRTTDYKKQGTYVQLHNAVIIQQLTPQQIDIYLTQEEEFGIREALSNDAILRELVTTPLMFSIVLQTYQGKSFEEIQLKGDLDAQRKQIFSTYVQRMFQHRGAKTRFTLQQTKHWLTWLAQQLTIYNHTEFNIEQMQPNWLPNSKAYKTYIWLCIAIVGLIGLLVGSFYGWIGALIGTVLGGNIGFFMVTHHAELKDEEIQPEILFAKGISWSWKKIQRSLVLGIEFFTHPLPERKNDTRVSIIMLGIILIVFAIFGGLSIIIYVIIAVVFVSILSIGFANTFSENNSSNTSGSYRALRSTFIGTLTGLICMLIIATILYCLFTFFRLISAQNIFLSYFINGISDLVFSPKISSLLASFILIGALIGLNKGIFASIQYSALRVAFWYHKCTPRNYHAFLNYATERVLLHKVGENYVFFHQLLLEYFLTLDSDDIERIHSLNALARAYFLQKNYSKVVSILQITLADSECVLGSNHPDIATTLNNLAATYLEMEQYDQAIPLLQRGLNIREQNYEPNHLDVIKSTDRLVYAYRTQKKLADAEAVLLRSLTLHEQKYGSYHPDTTVARRGLAEFYIEEKYDIQAEELLKKLLLDIVIDTLTLMTLEELQKKRTQSYIVVSDVLRNIKPLVHLYLGQNLSIDGETLTKALNIYEMKRYHHSELAMNMDHLARLYIDQNRYNDAEPLSRSALSICEYELPPNTSILAHYIGIYALILQKLNRDAEAVALIERAKKIHKFWRR